MLFEDYLFQINNNCISKSMTNFQFEIHNILNVARNNHARRSDLKIDFNILIFKTLDAVNIN